jgi:hypothetical protein
MKQIKLQFEQFKRFLFEIATKVSIEFLSQRPHLFIGHDIFIKFKLINFLLRFYIFYFSAE